MHDIPQTAYRKKALIVEYNEYHDILFPSIVKSLLDLEYYSTIFTTQQNINRDIFSCIPVKPDKFINCSLSFKDSFFKPSQFFVKLFNFCNRKKLGFISFSLLAKQYDIIIFNTFDTTPSFERLKHFCQSGKKTLAFVHRADIVHEEKYKPILNSPNLTILCLAKHVCDYLAEHNVTSKWCPIAYFGEHKKQNAFSDQTLFAVQGNLDFFRRNYSSLVEAVEELVRHQTTNFLVRIVGNTNTKYAALFKRHIKKKKIDCFFEFFEDDVPYNSFFRLIADSDFILVLQDRTSLCYYPYFEFVATTSVCLAVGLNATPIMHNEMAAIYNLPEQTALTYDDHQLTNALATAIEIKNNKYIFEKYKSKLNLIKDNWLLQTQNTFGNAVK